MSSSLEVLLICMSIKLNTEQHSKLNVIGIAHYFNPALIESSIIKYVYLQSAG